MLCASLLANAAILPQARQGSYFFNRIGQKPPVGSGDFRPASVIQNWLIGKSQTIERVYEIRGDSLSLPVADALKSREASMPNQIFSGSRQSGHSTFCLMAVFPSFPFPWTSTPENTTPVATTESRKRFEPVVICRYAKSAFYAYFASIALAFSMSFKYVAFVGANLTAFIKSSSAFWGSPLRR